MAKRAVPKYTVSYDVNRRGNKGWIVLKDGVPIPKQVFWAKAEADAKAQRLSV